MSKLSNPYNNEIHQRVTAHLKLPEYDEASFIPGRDTYSIFNIDANSSVTDNYKYTVDFVSDESINVEDIVDTEAELSLRDEASPLNSKKIYGKIILAKEIGSVARKKLYQIDIVSPLQYLSLNKRYEIYQDKNVVEIINDIISRYDVLLKLQLEIKVDVETIPKRHYCTQYAQSDLEFIKMLCEEEGYVLLCNPYKNDTYTITLCELNEHAVVVGETQEATFNYKKTFASSANVQDYYENKKPSLDYSVESGASFNTSSLPDNETTSQLRSEIKNYKLRDRLDKLEQSLYKDLSRYTKIDAQTDYARAPRVIGTSESLELFSGISLTLENNNPNKTTEVIILNTKIKAHFPNALDEYVKNEKDEEAQYSVEFEAIPKDIIYKPEKLTQKPTIYSIQTAIVSGGKKETSTQANTIDVNEFGEIRVIFHFDKNRPTSCYIPLSNIYSGDGYGAQFIPRVNSEVIVSFINGDIDRPVITGTLHNGENRHPYNLPKEKTSSFIKTQTTPQYEDKEGYNELLFEDKQGQEQLNLRAQRDYNLNVLNDSNTHIENDSKTIVDNDSELTVANNSHETVGNDKELNILGNSTTIIEKEMLTSVKLDQETHILKNSTTLIRRDQKSIIEKDVIQRIKGTTTKYIEKDAKEKYLQNLYTQVGQSVGMHVTESYHLNAKSIKQKAKIIELEAQDGISLKCAGNVLTVDTSGIHLKAAVVDATSSNSGVKASSVTKPKIEKPLYNKLRVTKLTQSITKQNEITDVLTYTAEVEKYENGVWAVTTELTASQEAQINWVFIKNNDEDDKDIISDNPTNDSIVVKALEMSVTVESDNIYKYGHAFAFVVDADEEGSCMSELKRKLNVENIRGKNLILENDTEVKYKVKLNLDDPTKEELETLKVEIDSRDADNKHTKTEMPLDDSLIITHPLKAEHTTQEINVHVYPQDNIENGAKTVTYGRPIKEGEVANVRKDTDSDEYIDLIDLEEPFYVRADANIKPSSKTIAGIDILGKNEKVLHTQERETSVKGGKIEEAFDLKKILEQNNIPTADVKDIKGYIEWE